MTSGYDAELTNHDLMPVPPAGRTWSVLNFTALWIGMCICIPSYMIASSLIEGGMNVMQALFTVFLGNVIVLIPMVLNGHVGVKYGIPFPIYARLSFGVKGANIPALLRAIVACGWFGIQCWIGGTAIFTMLSVLWPGVKQLPAILPEAMGVQLVPFLCFLVFWSINLLLIHKGINSIKKLETFCAPILVLSGVALLIWAGQAAGGFASMLSAPSQFKNPTEFWNFFVPSLTGMVGFWATLSLNIPDFTRYAKNQRAQIVGQALGLPTTMTFIAFIGVAVTSASFHIFGTRIWDPIALVGKINNPLMVFTAMLLICIATLAMNVAANVVAPANDFANLAPSKIDFKRGGTLTAIIGLVIMPWKLIADPSGYIFTWLIGYSALLGPVAGILLIDYFWVRRCQVEVADLYRKQGRYTYQNGYNPTALIALTAGILPNIPGFLTQIKAIPTTSIPAFFLEIYHNAWFAGLLIAGLVYALLMQQRSDEVVSTPLSSLELSGQPIEVEITDAGD